MPDLSWLPAVLSALIGPYGVVLVLLALVYFESRVILDFIGRLSRGDLVNGVMVATLSAAITSMAESNVKQAAVSEATLRALEQRGPRGA